MPTSQSFFLRQGMLGLAFLGLFFIGYGVLSKTFNSPWPLVEKVGPLLSSILTIVATLVTTSSVYFAPLNTPPERISKKYTAKIVIALCLGGLVILVFQGLDPVVINGFAMLGLAGALMRIQPNPHYYSDRFDAAFEKRAHVLLLVEFIANHHSEHIDECLQVLNTYRSNPNSP